MRPSSLKFAVLGITAPAFLLAGASFATPRLRFSQNISDAPVNAAFFDRQIKPILEKRCLGCHGVGNKLSGLDLRTRESALKGGLKGAAFSQGSADNSLLFKMVTGA